MRVLVAARAPSSDVDGFTFTREGELVRIDPVGDVCGRPNRCGCGRSFTGIDTHRATTVAKVVELDSTREKLLEGFVASTAASGWTSREAIDGEAVDAMLSLAAEHPLDAIIAHPNKAK